MIGLCDNCALKYADCKGNKDKEKCRCDYYKKPVVMNVKELAERVAELEVKANRYKWTPITEKEPDPAKHVLVTLKWKDDDYEVCGLDYGVTKHCMNNDSDEDVVRWCKQMIEHVIAWMPTPEPYKDGDTK